MFKTFKTIWEEIRYGNKDTFAYYNLSEIALKLIWLWANKYNCLEYIEPIHSMHVTTVYTKEYLNISQSTRTNFNLKSKQFSIFGNEEKKYLVLELEKDYELDMLFAKRIEQGYKPDHKIYKPHITLIKNFNGSVEMFPVMPFYSVDLETETVKHEDIQ